MLKKIETKEEKFNRTILKPLLIFALIVYTIIKMFLVFKGVYDYKKEQLIKQEEIMKERKRMADEYNQKMQEEIKKLQKLEEKKRKEAKLETELNKNKAIASWDHIKKEYPKGTYVLKIKTMEKGRVCDYQGERVFTDMGWYFDYDVDDIEIIGYKEYAKYKKIMNK